VDEGNPIPDPGRVPARTSREQVPVWADSLTRWLDDWVRIPGTRIGIGADAVIGLLFPGLGDLVTGAGSIAVLWLAARSGVPKVVLLRMLVNIAIDAVVGSVPILGDLFDVAFKANRRNLELLRRHQTGRTRATAGDYAIVILAAVLLLAAIALPLLFVGALIRWVIERF
jgi:hypothetical protein